jgi:hypothetical protein
MGVCWGDSLAQFGHRERKKGSCALHNPLDYLVAGVRFELTTFGL